MTELAEKDKDIYQKRICDFKSISVREKAGANIIQQLLGKEVPVLIDPTLMLSKEEWLKIAEKPKELPLTKYLLTYFLGKTDSNTKEFIKKTAQLNHLKVVNLWDVKYKSIS